MSRWDNVNVLAANDEDAEPKIEEMEQDKFKVNNYIPQRYHPKYKKYAYIAAGSVLAVIVIGLIAVFATKSRDSKIDVNDALTNLRSKLVLLANDTKLLRYDPRTKNATLLFETNRPVVAFDVLADRRVFWTETIDVNSTRTRLRVLQTNGSLLTLIDDARFQPRGMVLDHVTNNLYAVDETSGNLVVVDTRTGEYALLMSELVRPHEIALDPEEGLMFILQLSDSILRARMDGTDVSKLASNPGATSLTVDPRRKRLYWINDFVNIESSDYDGNQRRSFFNDTVAIDSLAILDDQLYWFWPGYAHPSILLSCKISADDTCEEFSSYNLIELGDPKYVKGYSSIARETTTTTKKKNPCEIDNGGCQQLCLLNSRHTRSCACHMGRQTNPDKRSCREIRDFLLYPQAGLVHAKSIDGAGKDLIWPTAYKVDSIAGKGEIDFDYDLANDDFYWSDDFHVYRMKLKYWSNEQTTILRVNASNTIIEDIAYDWYTGNMYFVQRSKSGSKRHSLMMFNVRLGENYQKTLYTYRYDVGFGLQACPYALVLHPAKRSMFFTAGENGIRFIQHANMRAKTKHQIFNTFPAFVHEYRLIAVDYAKDRVYWIWDSDRVSVVKHSKFDGTDVRLISVDRVRNAKTIYVHQQWLYISNLTSIWRVHKETGAGTLRIAPSYDDDQKPIAGVRLISASVQLAGRASDNACATQDEADGCAQFCINAEDGASCDCNDGSSVRGNKCS